MKPQTPEKSLPSEANPPDGVSERLKSKNESPKSEDDFSLTKREVFLPLACAGGLGGICNTGIQFVIPSSSGTSPNESPGGSSANQLPSGGYVLTSLIFSVLVGAILSPAVAMFTVGLPNSRNWNRLLIMSVLFGAFLPVTVQVAQNSITSSAQIRGLEQTNKQLKEEKKDLKISNEKTYTAVRTLQKDIPATKIEEGKNLVEPDNVKLKAQLLFEPAFKSDNSQTIELGIKELENLAKQVKSTNNGGDPKKVEEKRTLLQEIDRYRNELQEKLNNLKAKETLGATPSP